jgi:hypothetical protein
MSFIIYTEPVGHAPTYRLTCPYCAGALYPAFFTSESAPWLCVICHNSWWASELSEAARKQFRSALCDFGFGQSLLELHDLVLQERESARARGTSVRVDQLQLLPLHILQRLPGPTTKEFGELLKLEISRKGG